MTIFLNIAFAFGLLTFGYLIGSIPTGVIIGKVFFGKDPRKEGSHGSGGTNSSRVLGKKTGIIVICLDIFKTISVFWASWSVIYFSGIKESIALWDNGVLYLWLSVLGCAIGHCYPVYIGFRGGKAVACFMGATGGENWLLFLLDFIVFFGVYRIGKKKNIVSFASILSSMIISLVVWTLTILTLFGINTSILSWDFGLTGTLQIGWEEGLITTFIHLLLLWRHRVNIKRLKSDQEAAYNLFGK